MNKQTTTAHGMAERNNPLGQRFPSGKVGPDDDSTLEHEQSAEQVEKVRERAHQIQGEGFVFKDKETQEYDPKGPDRQPGKVAKQEKLGQSPRQKQLGQYTQDNEEEGPTV